VNEFPLDFFVPWVLQLCFDVTKRYYSHAVFIVVHLALVQYILCAL